MITYLDDHTIRLEPDRKSKCGCHKPIKRLNWLETEIAGAIKNATQSEVQKHLWLKRQLRRAAEYQKALEARGCQKVEGGLRGWSCPRGTHVMRKD